MWLPKDGRPLVTPEHWDDIYNAKKTQDANHVAECMRLIGDVTGKRVLDLGGGVTLCEPMRAATSFTVVDFSQEACSQVVALGHHGICADIAAFLRNCTSRWDIVVSFGAVDYMPAGSLELMFELCPADVFALGTPNGESYLQYKTRAVAYSRQDVLNAAMTFRWEVVELETERKSHTWARFKRAA